MVTPYLLTFTLLLSTGMCRTIGGDLPLEGLCLPGSDCTVKCTAEAEPGVQYVAVRWYKFRDYPSPRQSGLLTRNLPDGVTRWYAGVDREVKLHNESLDIFMSNVTCSDSGMYMCYLAAPVGEQNREGRILLTLEGCPVEPEWFFAGPTESVSRFPVQPEGNLLTDGMLVLFASVMLIVALMILLISYCCLKNTITEKVKAPVKEVLLNAPLKPLDKKDLMLIYTLGPKKSTGKHICV